MRIYYEDTDAAGIVYYANYLKFAERARTEMIRCLGFEHRRSMAEAGGAFAVRSCTAEYLLPARINAVGGASIKATQRVVQLDDDGNRIELVHLKIRLACLDKFHRPARLPADIRGAIAALMAS